MKPAFYTPKVIDVLLQAFADHQLGHQSPGNCALTHLLGGNAWMDVIHPSRGTIDHNMKLTDPRKFALGLREIRNAGFTISQILGIEAAFAGRVQLGEKSFVATLDDDTDPDGVEGLAHVLELMEVPRFHHVPSLRDISIKALVKH
ncbi:MAG: hypothetical protein R3C61_05330 [Bacteroidia bacterium]